MTTISIFIHMQFNNHILLLFRRFGPHDMKGLLIERDIRVSLMHHCLKLSHDLREKIFIAIASDIESLHRIMDIKLSICRLLTFYRQRAPERWWSSPFILKA